MSHLFYSNKNTAFSENPEVFGIILKIWHVFMKNAQKITHIIDE